MNAIDFMAKSLVERHGDEPKRITPKLGAHAIPNEAEDYESWEDFDAVDRLILEEDPDNPRLVTVGFIANILGERRELVRYILKCLRPRVLPDGEIENTPVYSIFVTADVRDAIRIMKEGGVWWPLESLA